MKNEIKELNDKVNNPKSKPVIIDSLRILYWIPFILGILWCVFAIIGVVVSNNIQLDISLTPKFNLFFLLLLTLMNSILIIKLSLKK